MEITDMDMLELRSIQDTFVTGLGAVEHIGGGNYRFTFFTCQDVQGRQERVVAAKVIMSIETLPDAIHMAARLTNLCACENVKNLARN